MRIDERLLALAGDRFNCASFTGTGDERLTLNQAPPNVKGPFEEFRDSPGGHGSISVRDRLLEAKVSANDYSAESALRVLFQVSLARQGGVLVHSSSIRFEKWAVVGVGHSTAGKSTLARLCREAGGQLLSDEITALFPDGTVYGTPFRSSDPTPGHPGPAKLGLLVLLDKAPLEELVPIAPEKALPQILAQVYRGYDGGELTPARILERVAGAMNVCPPQVLRFRKDPEAGHFVRRYLERL